MTELVWISGASSGIGQALVESVPWPSARVIGICRRPPTGAEHLAADLADPASWDDVEASFGRELQGYHGDRVVFIHAAGTIVPMGFAGEVDTPASCRNVLLNSAAPQVLGHMFLAAVARHSQARRHLVMLTSGAAKSVYPGWSTYGGAKAAIDQWVRDVGAEQELRGGVRVLAVAPGTVDTDMQSMIRSTGPEDFPSRQKFLDLYEGGKLISPREVATRMWQLLDRDLDNGSVVDLRDLPS